MDAAAGSSGAGVAQRRCAARRAAAVFEIVFESDASGVRWRSLMAACEAVHPLIDPEKFLRSGPVARTTQWSRCILGDATDGAARGMVAEAAAVGAGAVRCARLLRAAFYDRRRETRIAPYLCRVVNRKSTALSYRTVEALLRRYDTLAANPYACDLLLQALDARTHVPPDYLYECAAIAGKHRHQRLMACLTRTLPSVGGVRGSEFEHADRDRLANVLLAADRWGWPRQRDSHVCESHASANLVRVATAGSTPTDAERRVMERWPVSREDAPAVRPPDAKYPECD